MGTLLPKIATGTAFWLALTVGLYCLAREAHRRAGKTPLLNPTPLAIAGICAALFVLQVPHAVYFESVSILHYLLGTAVVALAVPLYRNLERLARAAWPILLALVAGSLTSILAGLLIAAALGASTSNYCRSRRNRLPLRFRWRSRAASAVPCSGGLSHDRDRNNRRGPRAVPFDLGGRHLLHG